MKTYSVMIIFYLYLVSILVVCANTVTDDSDDDLEFQLRQWIEFEPNLNQLREEILYAHNAYRALHCAPPLVLDETLNQEAQAYAETMARSHIYAHNPDSPHGQNLMLASTTSSTKYFDGVGAVRTWYKEKDVYDFNYPYFSPKTGHFTQLVWKESERIGVGYAKAPYGTRYRYYVVVYYDPPGNVEEIFPQNVLPTQC